jgi:hypothetical protein
MILPEQEVMKILIEKFWGYNLTPAPLHKWRGKMQQREVVKVNSEFQMKNRNVFCSVGTIGG